jgi:hypothetical protein
MFLFREVLEVLYGLVRVGGHIEPEEMPLPFGSFEGYHGIQCLLTGPHFDESVPGGFSRMFESDHIGSCDQTIGGEEAT